MSTPAYNLDEIMIKLAFHSGRLGVWLRLNHSRLLNPDRRSQH